MDRRKKLLLNDHETVTDAALRRVADDAGLRVFPKARLGSVLDLDRSGLSDAAFQYGTKAELDFVLVDLETTVPQFAVEFDGPQHLTDPRTMERDCMKNEICERLGLPLLRIGAEYLREQGRTTVVGWLVHAWWMERLFSDLKARGEIPADQDYEYWSWTEHRPDKSVASWFSLDDDARANMRDAFLADLAPLPWASFVAADFGRPMVTGICLFRCAGDSYVVGESRLRNFGMFAGVPAWQLATDLAVADAGSKLLQPQTAYVRSSVEQVRALIERRAWKPIERVVNTESEIEMQVWPRWVNEEAEPVLQVLPNDPTVLRAMLGP